MLTDSRELKENWDEGHGYRRQILQLFENRPPMFQAMIPVGRCASGLRAYEWTAVTLFDAINADDVAWDSLEERMRTLLPDHICIEICQRTGPLFCNDDQLAISVSGAKYIGPPRSGCDISPQNNLAQRLEKSLIMHQSQLASLEYQLQLRETDPYIGSVYFAKLGCRDYSTASLDGQTQMDVALIQMDCLSGKPPQEIYWKRNEDNPLIEKNTTCNFWEVDFLGHSQDDENHIKVVAKLSRRGYYTMGIVNEFRATILPFYENGRLVPREVDAWAIPYPRRHGSPGDNPQNVWPFSGW